MHSKALGLLALTLITCLAKTAHAGLVNYWNFDEGTGTNAMDRAGSYVDSGVLQGGASWVANAGGYGILLDGATGYVALTNSPEINLGTNDFAFAFTLNLATNKANFIYNQRKASSDFVQISTDAANQLKLSVNLTNGTVVEMRSSINLQTNVTYRVAMVAKRGDPASSFIYIDGADRTFRGTGTPLMKTNDLSLGTTPAAIGRWQGGNGVNNYAGMLDEFRVYNHALSPAEIVALVPPEPSLGLLNYWSFADTNAASAKDISGVYTNTAQFQSGASRTEQGGLGAGLYLDGTTNAYALIDASPDLDLGTRDFSFSFWMRMDTTNRMFVFNQRNGSGTAFVEISQQNACIGMSARISSDIKCSITSQPILTSNRLYHVAFVANRNNVTNCFVYIDGLDATEHSVSVMKPDSISTGLPAALGRWQGNGYYFQGMLDEFRIYDVALTAQQVRTLGSNIGMSAAQAAPASLQLSWNSRDGKLYDLLSSTNIQTPLTNWATIAASIPATPQTNTVTVTPAGSGPSYFALREFPNLTTNPAAYKILAVGDSITVGYTDNPNWTVPYEYGFRSGLYTRLTNSGMAFQFVGQSPEPWDGKFGLPTNTPLVDLRGVDQDHCAGYGGKKTDYVAANIGSWLQLYSPDIILLMIGINDIGTSSVEPVSAELNLSNVVQTVVNTSPKTRTIVAQITPRSSFVQGIALYNTYIDQLVASFAAQGKNVSLVNQYTNLCIQGTTDIDPTLFSNGSNHPGATGYDRMAQTWFDGIQALQLPPAKP